MGQFLLASEGIASTAKPECSAGAGRDLIRLNSAKEAVPFAVPSRQNFIALEHEY